MVQPSNTSAIATATARPWEEWIRLMDEAGARQLAHKDIAVLARDLMPETTPQKDWWAQSIAVAFAQHAGLRVPGQMSTGDFQFSVSKTYTGDKDAALQAWLAVVGSRTEFGGVPVDGEPAVSSTQRWRYWRLRLADTSRVTLSISDKSTGKSSLGLEHSKLDSAEAISFWRPVWKDLLAQL